ncbi:MAG: putative sugar nucleotidyl transferase [Candidatus Kapaibacteriota bacterium]
MMHLVLIEHSTPEDLYPFTLTHCTWELRHGAFTILERWRRSVPELSISIRSHRTTHALGFCERSGEVQDLPGLPTLVMVGHAVLSPSVMLQIVESCRSRTTTVNITLSGHVIGTYHPGSGSHLGPEGTDHIAVHGHLVTRLWQSFDHVADAISWDAALLDRDGLSHVSPTATVHPTAVLDTSHGPVVLLDHAVVRPYTVLTGPVVVGEHSLVQPFTSLTSTVLGPWVKVGGEVSHSVIQGYANKVHDGYLGHSYLNEWTNLGAGTTTSNLKNTYGHVRLQMPWGREDSQRTFVGLLMGAHSKTAIGTLFSTGTTCGACSNITLPAPSAVPSLWWGPTQEEYRIDDAIAVAKTVMARREMVLGPAMEAVLRALRTRQSP